MYELDSREIRIILGRPHTGAAARAGKARRKVRIGYRTRSKPPEARGIRWLIDSGCGHDLTKRLHVVRLGLGEQVVPNRDDLVCSTPGRSWPAQCVDSEIQMSIPALVAEVPVIVLRSTPNVLSIGWRCALDGYKSVWDPHSDRPNFVTGKRKKVGLSVDGIILSISV